MTPLMFAARRKDGEDATVLLVAFGATLDMLDNRNRTAYFHARSAVPPVQKAADVLGDHGAAKWSPRVKYNASMMRAVFYGRADMVKRAVEKNADVNFATQTGKTVLFQATVMGHGDVVQTLKRYGAKNQVEFDERKKQENDKVTKNRTSTLTGMTVG